MALITKTFTVNGKTYSSPEEMPPDVRALYDRAMAMRAGAASPGTKLRFSAKLKFNGKEYDSPDTMPPEVRRLYEDAIAIVSKDELASTTLRTEADVKAQIMRQLAARKAGSGRLGWVVLGLLALILALFFLSTK